MKKYAAMILALILALSSVGAFAVTPAELLGIWYTSEADEYGDIYILTGDYYLELKRDSTAVLVMNGQEKAFTWKAQSEGAVLTSTEDGKTIDFTYEDGVLKANFEDFSLEGTYSCSYVFSREEPEKFEVPDVKLADQEESFFGEWKAEFTVTERGIKKASEEDAAKMVTVEFAQIKVTDGENVYYALTNFDSGKLTFSAEDLNLGKGTVVVELAGNSYARITLDGVPAETYNFYLVKVDSAAEEEVVVGEAAATEEVKGE